MELASVLLVLLNLFKEVREIGIARVRRYDACAEECTEQNREGSSKKDVAP
jgi:hypothetical protein